MRRGHETHVAHMIQTNKGAYLNSWNTKVQRVWVSWWGGTSGKY